MADEEKIFKYKLDFYYQSALIYLLTLIVYGGIRGNFVEAEFKYVLNDPLLYVITFFVVMSFVSLLLNMARNRRLIITKDEIIFKHHWDERRIAIRDLEWMHIGREMLVQTAGHFQLVIFKMKGRKRLFRIRVGRYERDRELVAEMERIAQHVPKGKRRRFGMRRRKGL